ncbi:MAG: hypothetical protein H6972_13360 [Gammaproteobacteria bacterium]|nr:hypothetical protein [Gammaproteobacteria bacterium]
MAPDESGSNWDGFFGVTVVCNGGVVAVQVHQNRRRSASLEAEPLAKGYDHLDWRHLLEQHGIAPTLADRA